MKSLEQVPVGVEQPSVSQTSEIVAVNVNLCSANIESQYRDFCWDEFRKVLEFTVLFERFSALF